MEFLGVGPLELLFILIVALIVMGPRDMVKTGKTLGRFLRRLVKSPTWQAVQQTSHDLRYLPNKLMRDAGVEEDIQDLDQIRKEMNEIAGTRQALNQSIRNVGKELNEAQSGLSAWMTPPTQQVPGQATGNAATNGTTIISANNPPPTPTPSTTESPAPAESMPGE